MTRAEWDVAGPKRTKSTPSAIGSKVPQCPTFLMPRIFRTLLTTSKEVMPRGFLIFKSPPSMGIGCGFKLIKGILFYGKLKENMGRFFVKGEFFARQRGLFW